MVQGKTWQIKLFNILNITFLVTIAILCLIPFLHIIAISFSDKSKAAAGMVTIFPVDFSISAYKFALGRNDFVQAFIVTVERLVTGVALSMGLTIITAYPLSKESEIFKTRTFYVWFLFLTTMFTGGLIPTYLTVKTFGMLNSIASLVIPCSVQVFNIILLLNFFRSVPKELEESALMDGAGHIVILWKIYVPVSMAAIATVSLFTIVFHWNSYFDGLIYMLRPDMYPLQTYLYSLLRLMSAGLGAYSNDPEMNEVLSKVSHQTFRAAEIVLVSLPILMAYPFMQRYFISGIVMGSVKE